MIDTDNVVQFQAKNDLHRMFAPGVIDGPHTADSQRHHEWEDTARMASEGWGRLSFQIKALLVLVIVLAGIVLGSFLGTKVTRWLSSLDWSALSLIAGGKS